MNILIIGGAGYIGSNVTNLLYNRNNNDYILILDNFSTGRKEALVPGVDWVNVDVRNLEQLDSIFKYKNFDVVYDFSALTVVSESVTEPLNYYEDNFIGTFNILKCMEKYNVKNFIFSSTAAVYGNPNNNEDILEDSTKNPINPYGNSKLCSEFLIKDVSKAYGINYIIFRYFNVAGASDDYKYGFFRKNPTLLIPALNESIINNKTFSIFGNKYDTPDGTCVRDFIHVVDLAQAHLLAMDWIISNNLSNEFNLGSNKGFSVKEVFDEAMNSLNKKINFNIESPRKGDPARLITNNHKAESILKWKPLKTLKNMIDSDYEFRLRNKDIINNSK